MRVIQYLYVIYFCLVFLLVMILGYPVFKWSIANPKKHIFSFQLSRTTSRIILFLAGWRLKALVTPFFPEKAAIICPNHTSYIDILTMYAIAPYPLVFMGKKELEKWPFIKLFFKGKHILVDRNNPIEAKKSLEKVEEKLTQGFQVVIFPEGGFGKQVPQLRKFKMGAFKVAQKKGVPIVPVVFHDNWRRFFWSKHKKRVSLGTLRFQVMPALTAAGESEEDLLLLRDKVFEGIQNKLHQEK